MYQCVVCVKAFPNSTVESVITHFRSTKHALKALHVETDQMNRCGMCYQQFSTLNLLENHLRSSRHFEEAQGHDVERVVNKPKIRPYRCEDCNKGFLKPEHLAAHMKSSVHMPCTQYHCCDCDRDFVSEKALRRHLNGTHLKIPNKLYSCTLCDKTFKKGGHRKSHMASIVHTPICKPFQCMASSHCREQFSTPSMMIQHLESGACISGLTRSTINKMIASHDNDHFITVPTSLRSISQADSDEGGVILTPTSTISTSLTSSWSSFSKSDMMDTPSESDDGLSLSGLSISSDGSRVLVTRSDLHLCPFCPATSNRFGTAAALKQHELSPAHAPKMFHCPIGLFDAKSQKMNEKKFSTLSGLAMHVESGACGKGRDTFRQVLNFVNERLQDFGLHKIGMLE